MKLTPFAKLFITVIILGVVGYVLYVKRDTITQWANQGGAKGVVPAGDKPSSDQPSTGTGSGGISKDDFAAIGAAREAGRQGVTGISKAQLGSGKLARKLRVGINTWAGHAPGIVSNGGLTSDKASVYLSKYGLDVEFTLLEDPQAKLAAFIKGDIDIMWDTVDSWAREASALAEQGKGGKAIIQQDWSRGGDGIVALSSIKSIEDLKGKKIATTRYTPSHWLLLYLLSQSGLSAADKSQIEKNLVFTAEAPLAAAAFKSKNVDAAVTWEPDLSGAVKARGDEAAILVSTTAATNVIADVLVAQSELVEKSPETVTAFIHGWFDGIDAIGKDPTHAYMLVGKALKLPEDDVSGMLSGMKLTSFADNALFFGLDGNKAQFEALFNAAFIVWRKQGVISKSVDAKNCVDTRFVSALADFYPGQKVVETFKFDPKKTDPAKERAIINKQLTIYFTTGSDQIMAGSHFVLDSLGETMTAFGNTLLRIEGNTDNTGSRTANRSLSQKRADAVKDYLIENHKVDPKRFQTVGNGPDNPVAPNTTDAGRQQNRRTDIKVILNVQ
ncbi:MAG TPA: phosphate ABC transporter substrate-binding/OmpA family protein [Pseudomonadota bacterium]|jgi:NitT/TauT family transport system substrate-binding protein|nr:phosphate ABC transporter substrate-binding/OmpA family protein [Pseudomonadota bacterium]HNK43993.1 phosphate ABC transporter substrate-binding/OmpA family protein [Pseudomonadota bacterium]HNN49848.1 phosphate ABC transporter substrate-binding/OmpA family protein [Pseudomonadota bacterium]HNO67002.1 phosphate ABC transporter substrate-binding/OmpA family protein [Pseudomonadota bacterium]